VRAIYLAGSAGKCKPPPVSDVIYSNNFEGVIGPEWSATNTATTPRGSRRFLGQFGNQTVALTLSNLPAHTNLTVACDLFVINTSDCSVPPGPDGFEAAVVGLPSLLHTAFANFSEKPQAFPGAFRNQDWPGFTGALEVNTLNYNPDSVYRLNFSFAHAGSVLQ